jgi:hypothetical protein
MAGLMSTLALPATDDAADVEEDGGEGDPDVTALCEPPGAVDGEGAAP